MALGWGRCRSVELRRHPVAIGYGWADITRSDHRRIGHSGRSQRGDRAVARSRHRPRPPALFWGRTGSARAAMPSAARIDAGVVGDLERPSAVDPVDHQQVTTLAGQLVPGVIQHGAVLVAGLGGEPDDHRPGGPGPGAAMPTRMSGFCTSASGAGSWPARFLILVAAGSAGRKSATAAAITTASAPAAELDHRALQVARVPHRHDGDGRRIGQRHVGGRPGSPRRRGRPRPAQGRSPADRTTGCRG